MVRPLQRVDPLTAARRFFYLLSPNETSFERVEDVPEYLREVSRFSY